jgi:O-antigen/teichoic acid export membrane protein
MPGTLSGALLRYGASVAGPVAVSGAHFLASLIFLHQLPVREFGLFSFVMVSLSLGLSLSISLISLPLTRSLTLGDGSAIPACFQMNWMVCIGFAASLLAALLAGGASLQDATLLALFAGAFTFRCFARALAFVESRATAAIRSDLTYSLVLIGSLGMLAAWDSVSFAWSSGALLLSALAALLPFGAAFFRGQLAALKGDPRAYLPIFRDVTRWSLAGAVLTELTINAHAYLVTFIAGPGAFALLALGMLLMRPASLTQLALTDLERPAMARAMGQGDRAALRRIRRHFTCGLGTAWLANILLCVLLLAFFPSLVVRQDYSMENVIMVVSLCALIVAMRSLRTPQAALLQAAGRFKELACIGAASAIVSLLATVSLLFLAGPIASLGGIVLGELVILTLCFADVRWKPAEAGHD